jgi:hypothetical protein
VLLLRFTHAAEALVLFGQGVVPAALHPHTRLLHVRAAGQISPHAPQLFRSFDSLTQVAEGFVLFGQGVVPAVLHPQRPLMQARLAGQVMPHPPQLFRSVLKLKHPIVGVVHLLNPVLHENVQLLAEQAGVALESVVVQARPQAPQLLRSFVSFTHAPPLAFEQNVSPAVVHESQLPLSQPNPVAQRVPHPPQLLVSVCAFTQAVGAAAGQAVKPVAHPHTPALQVSGVEQVLAQAPQLALSVCRSVQIPEQSV